MMLCSHVFVFKYFEQRKSDAGLNRQSSKIANRIYHIIYTTDTENARIKKNHKSSRLDIAMKVVILTGSETRHTYFRMKIGLDKRIDVLATYCEGAEKSLENRVLSNPKASGIERLHVAARTQAEEDFFGIAIASMKDSSNAKPIQKGSINNAAIVEEIESSSADLLVCYGSSLIKSNLLESYSGRFLNVHLGLSPYYRGSGTNVWPLINKQPDMVGATFMHIDEGIDTGKIIHQIRADIVLGDSPHSIGNRLIKKMTDVYCDIVARFYNLSHEEQPVAKGSLYLQKHFDEAACETLYRNLNEGLIRSYIESEDSHSFPYIVNNRGLSQ